MLSNYAFNFYLRRYIAEHRRIIALQAESEQALRRELAHSARAVELAGPAALVRILGSGSGGGAGRRGDAEEGVDRYTLSEQRSAAAAEGEEVLAPDVRRVVVRGWAGQTQLATL